MNIKLTASLPFGKYLMVGKLWTLTSSTSLAVASILAMTMSGLSLYFWPSSSQMGISCLQWPHQGASITWKMRIMWRKDITLCETHWAVWSEDITLSEGHWVVWSEDITLCESQWVIWSEDITLCETLGCMEWRYYIVWVTGLCGVKTLHCMRVTGLCGVKILHCVKVFQRQRLCGVMLFHCVKTMDWMWGDIIILCERLGKRVLFGLPSPHCTSWTRHSSNIQVQILDIFLVKVSRSQSRILISTSLKRPG